MDRPILLIFRSVQSSPQSLHILILRTIGLVLQKNLTIKVQRELGHLLHHLPAYRRILMMLRRTLEGNAMDFFSLAYPCHVVIFVITSLNMFGWVIATLNISLLLKT
jgi:hypothetical protein